MQSWKLIYSYTRANALSDGILIDVTETAKSAGFIIPVAITVGVKSLINNCPKLSGNVWEGLSQDYESRLWDILWMAYVNTLKNLKKSIFKYKVILPHYETVEDEFGDKEQKLKKEAILKTIISAGDDGEPVLTIMLPEED